MQDAAPTGHFTTLDWGVLAGYLLLLVVTGVAFTRRQRDTTDYFLAGRRMPAWAVAVSILATALSAATFIGGPQTSYGSNLAYLSTNLGGLIAIVFVALFIVPACYRRNVTTVYELLDERFGPTTRRAAGLMYMLGRTLAIGARGYIGALPASLIIWGDLDPGHVATAVLVLTAVGVLYTLVGGIGTVIWTDVVQTAVFVAAALAALWLLLDRIPLGLPEILHELRVGPPAAAEQAKLGAMPHESKLTLFDLSLDPTRSFTLWTALVAFTLMGIASYGTDQDMVQRMLTCRNSIAGSRSAILGIVLGIPVAALFLFIGLLLFVFYQRPDIMGEAAPGYEVYDSRKIFLSFILREIPAGLSGLMIAGLFAAGLSSVNSTLNAMSATLVEDFYKPAAPGRSDRHYLNAGRAAVAFWGLAVGAVGCLSIAWERSESGSLLDFALSVMTFAYAGLVGVFLSAILTRRGNTASALAAFAVGIIAVTAQQPGIWPRLTGAEMTLAWPWRFVIAAVIAFAVCQLGSPTGARRASEGQRARSASEGHASPGSHE